ncbi:hypothetical protein WA026_015806 [Henosepilachna vigintioctopunctata]|uniref:Large ribosomal subunit protein mL66 n=1 Tax=Henosepilachna vigintioctopunctata TaxID=420089 RepID=A0AAW1UZH9_9CUCU
MSFFMQNSLRNILNTRILISENIKRNIFASTPLAVKEIRTVENGKDITISAEIIESERKPFLVENNSGHACPLCASGLDVKHTDVLILSQFIRSDGCMMPKRITGLCNKQQRRISSLVTMAQKSGLMPNIAPPNSKRNPQTRFGWKKFNKYFDETTIKSK